MLEVLQKEAGASEEEKFFTDLDFLIGSWVSDEEIDKALAEQRQVNPKDWR